LLYYNIHCFVFFGCLDLNYKTKIASDYQVNKLITVWRFVDDCDDGEGDSGDGFQVCLCLERSADIAINRLFS
jgi:hypothetical protein